MPTWLFFHTLIANIPETQYVAKDVLGHVKSICAVLPCPDCASHATEYLAKIEPRHVPRKEDFRRMLWVFHNAVNLKTRKPQFPYERMTIYDTTSIQVVFNVFAQKFTKRQQTRLFTDSLMRTRIVAQLRAWLATIDFLHGKPN